MSKYCFKALKVLKLAEGHVNQECHFRVSRLISSTISQHPHLVIDKNSSLLPLVAWLCNFLTSTWRTSWLYGEEESVSLKYTQLMRELKNWIDAHVCVTKRRNENLQKYLEDMRNYKQVWLRREWAKDLTGKLGIRRDKDYALDHLDYLNRVKTDGFQKRLEDL